MKKIALSIITLILFAIIAISINNDKKLKDQNIALLGDSMTWYGGDSCQKSRGWSHHFKQAINPKSITVYARSGATWTNTSNTKADTKFYTEKLNDLNVIHNEVLRMIDSVAQGKAPKPDVIVVYAGANDAWFRDRRPGIYDITPQQALNAESFPEGTKPSEVTSLAESIRFNCDIISKNFPDARIVLFTPMEMTKTPVEETTRVSNIIEEVGTGLGYEVYRPDKYVDIRHDIESKQLTYTCDGAHTNPAGAKLLATYITSCLTGDSDK